MIMNGWSAVRFRRLFFEYDDALVRKFRAVTSLCALSVTLEEQLHSRTTGAEPTSDRVGEALCFLQLLSHSQTHDGEVARRLRFRVDNECSMPKHYRGGTVNPSVLDVIEAIINRFKGRSFLPWALLAVMPSINCDDVPYIRWQQAATPRLGPYCARSNMSVVFGNRIPCAELPTAYNGMFVNGCHFQNLIPFNGLQRSAVEFGLPADPDVVLFLTGTLQDAARRWLCENPLGLSLLEVLLPTLDCIFDGKRVCSTCKV
jgi:hypothetical protein